MSITVDKIVRSRRRTLALVVTTDAQVVVRVPWSMPQSVVDRFVETNAEWIRKKLAYFSERAARAHHYTDGDEFLFRGETLKLRCVEGISSIGCEGESLVVPAASPKAIAAGIRQWYREQASLIIPPRVAELARRHGFSYKSIRINRAERRWGSCGYRNTLNFAWKLVMAPDDVIDYVIVHELCHTVEKNHSKRFWDRVRAIVPDCKEKKAWFRRNQPLLG